MFALCMNDSFKTVLDSKEIHNNLNARIKLDINDFEGYLAERKDIFRKKDYKPVEKYNSDIQN